MYLKICFMKLFIRVGLNGKTLKGELTFLPAFCGTAGSNTISLIRNMQRAVFNHVFHLLHFTFYLQKNKTDGQIQVLKVNKQVKNNEHVKQLICLYFYTSQEM